MHQGNYTRREFLKAAGFDALALSLASRARPNTTVKELTVYIGTYTNGRSEGIYTYRLNLASGELKHLGATKGVVNPSFLAIDRQGSFLYAVNEVNEFKGKPSGAVSAFSIDRKTGSPAFLNQQPSLGSGPCHLTIDRSGRFMLVANYNGGSVSVLPINNGSLGEPTDMVQHRGSSVNPERQKGPHAHGVVLDNAGRYLFVPDLGLDKIMIYRFDSVSGKLAPNLVPWAELKPGAGPRHFAFHPNGRWAYVINELNSSFTTFTYDSARGTLKERQTISTLPPNFSGKNSCAELQVAASGKFLYGSNRGHDSIVVFSIEPQTGKLDLVEHVSTQGKTPRNFAIDPTGSFLLAANQNSDSVVSFRIDRVAGKLSPTGHMAGTPTPVCIVMSDKL
jgi:6-phosphogluconolactonase